jgi:cell division protein FtsA
MLNNYVCALDIGSSKIVAAVAKMRKRRIENIFFDSVPSKGVRHGTIVDSINLVEAVTKLMKNLKAKSGINIKLININISGQDILTKHSRAIVPLAERGSKVITLLDIQKVNEQARILGSSLDEEIIHAIPLTYSIDSKSNIANPLGLYSHKLEVDLYLVCARLSCVQSLARAINQSGYEIKNLFFSGLASSTVVFDKELKEGTNLFCDIGSETTELLVFSSGELKDIEILSFGGNDLTASLQDALKIPFELAEEIKTSYGIVGESQQISIDKEILVKKNDFYKPIKQRIVSEVITSSAKLICAHIKESVDKKIPAYEVNNFIIVGRTVLLEGFIETLENTLSITVKLGRILNPGIPSSIKEVSTLSQTAYLTYLTSLGIICSALTDRTVGTLPVNEPSKNIIVKTFNRFKEAYQEYF